MPHQTITRQPAEDLPSLLHLTYVKRVGYKDADECDLKGCHRITRYNARSGKRSKERVHLCERHAKALISQQWASANK